MQRSRPTDSDGPPWHRHPVTVTVTVTITASDSHGYHDHHDGESDAAGRLTRRPARLQRQ
eukprot:3412354-Rhodomonas_salina.1